MTANLGGGVDVTGGGTLDLTSSLIGDHMMIGRRGAGPLRVRLEGHDADAETRKYLLNEMMGAAVYRIAVQQPVPGT